MKRKFLLLSVMLFCYIISQAQIHKGAVLLGGNLGFGIQSNSSSNQGSVSAKQTNISLTPAFGKAVKENVVIGADFTYDYHKNAYDITVNDMKSTAVGGGVFVRKYKYLGNNFYLFGQGRIGANSITQESSYFTGQNYVKVTTKGYAVAAGFYPGISYAVTNKLHLETGFSNLVYVNFSHVKTSNQYNAPAEYKTNSFTFGSSLSNFSGFTLGIRFLINKQS
jgi:hypothetical protein